MRQTILIGLSLLALCGSARAEDKMKFWNTTSVQIKELYLAPPGTKEWGSNQTKNDPDGAVDADERLNLKGVAPGHYDVRLVDKNGRSCVVPNVEVKGGKAYAFSLADRDLKDCTK